ncbi:MAG: hypothetical protein KKI08_24795 [Armatimonadetes bacterium]|nr:hypothetical protein [Armatimonadota bacterium]
MFRSLLPVGVAVFVLCSAVAWSANPSIVQTVQRGDKILDLDISPTGGQMMVATDVGVYLYPLSSSGSMAANPQTAVFFPHTVLAAYTPGGKRVVVATSDGKLHVSDRGQGSLSHVGDITLGPGSEIPEDMYLLETPSLVFVKSRGSCNVFVADYKKISTPVQTVVVNWPGFELGRHVAARADASRVFWTARDTRAPYPNILYSKPYLGSGGIWCVSGDHDPAGLCIGPDPDHLLFVEYGRQDPKELKIVSQDMGAVIAGSRLTSTYVTDLAFTNDGYYAVLLDREQHLLEVVSGHDLRGRLDAAFNMQPDKVRRATLDVGGRTAALALHPLKPFAYVAMEDGRIRRVKLAIPGITHP